MEQTTITIDESTLERFKRLKAEATNENMPEQSADLFLQSLLDTWEAVDNGEYQDQAQEETLQEIAEQLRGLDGSQQTLDGKREVVNRIDDLETELTRKIEALQG